MNPLEQQAENILDLYVRPALSKHYGGVEIISLNTDTLYLKMLGQCRHCPSAQTDTSAFIQQQFRQHMPEIHNVSIIDDIDEDLLDLTYQILNHAI